MTTTISIPGLKRKVSHLAKISFFMIGMLLSPLKHSAQTVIDVYNYVDFRNAISNAITLANTGIDVTIKVHSALTCNSLAPTAINLTNGSITIKAASGVHSIDGTSFGSGHTNFLHIQSVVFPARFSIVSIVFSHFDVSSEVIKIDNDVQRVRIAFCRFENCVNAAPAGTSYNLDRITVGRPTGILWGIRSESANWITVEECNFEDNNNGIHFLLVNPSNFLNQSFIRGNNFLATSSFKYDYESIRIECTDLACNASIEIYDNTITNQYSNLEPSLSNANYQNYFKRAFSIVNEVSNPELSSLDVYMHENIVNGNHHFTFYYRNCLSRWRILDNECVSAFATGNSTAGFWHPALICLDNSDFVPAVFQPQLGVNDKLGIALIDQNDLNSQPKNSPNLFSGSSTQRNKYLSISIPDYPADLIGLDLPGSIAINMYNCGENDNCHQSNIIVRQCKIRTSIPNRPIDRGDGCLSDYELENVEYCGGKLYATLSLENQCLLDFENHGDFVVDFYTSNNTYGDLIDYLGSYTLDPTLTSPYQIELSIPPGVIMHSVEMVAATVTGLGNQSGTTRSGTSFVFYGEPKSCCCKDIQVTTTSQSTGSYIFGCVSKPMQFFAACGDDPNSTWPELHYQWKHDNLSWIDWDQNYPFQGFFSTPGYHTISVRAIVAGVCTTQKIVDVWISPCTTQCFDCIPAFSPFPNKLYVVSAWCRESNLATNYTKPQLEIAFSGCTGCTLTFTPKGKVIDGWQRIEEEFLVPSTATGMDVRLKSATTGVSVYFDDLRVFPKDGSMKSYVYNPETLKFVAEMDERNYSTFYEYDLEGKLIRIKKETEQGIMTVKEVRNNSSFAK